ncbi:GNAT family N-acetyltransferase [Naasia lichenicola]|uniref:GNAT family N-acetyltransferase n=1 Tax=Naasia lichenicola TaxID=2565933 RepID=A0A4S4FFY5_9MICO|nr:GNAT family N-acetyltransferase [Naasia lichenicola]THG28594.1 GNAT family N-acetyltransferase [Naasia lichenicola]
MDSDHPAGRFTVSAVDWDDPDAVALRLAQRAEIDELYGTPDSEPGPAPTRADVAVFFVARDAATGEPVACGGLRMLDDAAAEIKRMFVPVQWRGRGASVTMLSALEAEAVRRGLTHLRLETGERQAAAIRLYEREGYTRIPPFGYYVDSAISLCYEKAL